MSSDVCSDTSEDDCLNGSLDEKRRRCIKAANKGWSTCSNGFSDMQNDELSSSLSNYDSPNTSISMLQKTRKPKKCIKRLSGKYSGLKEVKFKPLSNGKNLNNIHISALNDFVPHSSPNVTLPVNSTDEACFKFDEGKNWSFIDSLGSFHGTPAKSLDIDKKDNEISTPIKIQIDLSPTSPSENAIEICSYDTNCSQNKYNDEQATVSTEHLTPQKITEHEDVKKEKVNSIHNAKSFCNNVVPNVASSCSIRHLSDMSKLDLLNLTKGSDWIKTLNFQENVTEENKVDFQDEKVYKTKNKKFMTGGLAEYAVKLAKKERSSRLIWLHKNRETTKRSEKCFIVKLGPFQSVDGMTLSKCLILKKPSTSVCLKYNLNSQFSEIPEDQALRSDKLNNCSEPVNSSIKDSQSVSREKMSEYFCLLLRPNLIKEFKLESGTVIRIHPPWQSLNIHSLPYPVILRTYYIDVLETSSTDANSVNPMVEEIIFQSEKYHAAGKGENSMSLDNNTGCMEQKSSKKTDIRTFFNVSSKSIVENNSSTNALNLEQLSLHCWSDLQLNSMNICGKVFPICAIVHRIWQQSTASSEFRYKYSLKNIDNSQVIRHHLLIQDKNYRFYKLHLQNPNDGDNSWQKLLQNGEGKWFLFKAVKVNSILHLSRFKALSSILNNILRKQEDGKEVRIGESFCYQLIANCSKNTVVNISNEPECPTYYQYEISLLKQLSEEKNLNERFSCYAKILCHYNSFIYITDKSLLKSSCPYVKIKFTASMKFVSNIQSGSNVLVAEATIRSGFLFIDNYSTIIPLREKDNSTHTKSIISERLTFSPFVGCCWKKFCDASKAEDIVFLKGTIQSVDENTAISWLECDSCGKENLYQDSKSRIFCDYCARIVKSPKLKMRMVVFVHVVELIKAIVTVQLSCATTKKLLQIPESVFRPKCDIKDVLHKKLGPLVCYIQSQECINNQLKFHLCEIVFS